MGRLFLLFALAVLALFVIALIDCLSTDKHEIRALPRAAWVLLIILLPVVGAVAWLVSGRPRPAGERQPGPHFRPARATRRPLAPDDDPEFLRDLGARARRDDEELLRRWEEDLRHGDDDGAAP